MYTAADVERLLRVKALRGLGFSLEKIKGVIGQQGADLSETIRRQIDRLREQIESHEQVRDRLCAIERCLSSTADVTVEELFKAIRGLEVLDHLDKYYDEEQLARLKARGEQIGPERIREVEGEWRELVARVREQMDSGTDPTAPPVLELARKWNSLIEEFTGADPGITKSLGKMWSSEPSLGQMTGIDSAMFAYIGKALALVRGDEPSR
jgi:hypothetical protein